MARIWHACYARWYDHVKAGHRYRAGLYEIAGLIVGVLA